MFTFGEVELRKNNVVKIGEREIRVDDAVYIDLYILKNEEKKKFEWVKFDDNTVLMMGGFYFTSDENSVLVYTPFANNKKALKMTREKERGSFRKSELYFEKRGEDIYFGKNKVDGIAAFERIVKAFGLGRENMSEELWEMVKTDIEYGGFAIVEGISPEITERLLAWYMWLKKAAIVEGSREKIENVINEVLINEL